MKFSWKTLMAVLCNAFGVFGWLYIGGYRLIAGPVKNVIMAKLAGHLSLGMVLSAAMKGFLYLSLAGGVWCIGYMLKNYFDDISQE